MIEFKFVNEGSRGEVDSYVGGVKELNELINRYISDRESLKFEGLDDEYVNEFMDIEFGGKTEDCFVEIGFGEEESVMVYMI